MDNIRLLLWATFTALLWFTYRAWVTQYPPPQVDAPPPAQIENGQVLVDPGQPLPGADVLPQLTQQASQAPQATPLVSTPAEPALPIRIQTDVFDVLIDGQGGDLVRAELPEYPVDKDSPDMPVRLLDFAEGNRWVFQTGLRGTSGGPEPNHLAVFTSPSPAYSLSETADELVVTLDWQNEGPLTAQKIYTFHRGRYDVDLNIVLENPTDAVWSGAAYAQQFRFHQPVERSFTSVDSYSFTGPVLYDADQYEKLDVEDLVTEPINLTVAGGWLASIEHHFLAAVVPPPEEEIHYQASARGQDYVITALTNIAEIPAGGRMEFPFRLFVGPKLQSQLAETGESLELTVDYGMLTILAQPLFWMLNKIHGFVGNWGWSIIIITFFIKLVFYKLTEASGRSMAKMRKLQPRMKALQETYKDSREDLSRHMMELYKREKVNPAAGCLPILIQMPFFFAFYWVLIESVEIRQAPFLLWINDLSSRDPFFVLPLLMGGAMLIQTRLNPAPPDPVQAKIMQIMPIVFTGFFAFFPAGLVLYWLTNTGLSILQQWRINKVIAD